MVIWLAQITTIWGVGTIIWYTRHHEPLTQLNLDLSSGANYYLDPVVESLKKQGLPATEEYLKKKFRKIVYVVDLQDNRELLGRNIPDDFLETVKEKSLQKENNLSIQRIDLSKQHYLLFVADTPSPWRRNQFFPIYPFIGATLASLLFAFLLARHLSRPIQQLKDTVSEIAMGRFKIYLPPQLNNRQDSLGELAVDIQNMGERLGNLIDSQKRLLHTISHELRSPLTRLQLATGLLRQKIPTNNEEMLRIERECKRIDQLIGELLTLSKLDDGINQVQQEVFLLNPLIHEIIENALFEAQNSNKEIIEMNKNMVQVNGNSSLLFYAIENVVRNALKHAKSSVTVEIVSNHDTHVDIIITDDGPGVSDNEIPKITQPFYRAQSSQQYPSNDGFGLGLAITHKTFKAHQGLIRFTNLENNQGFQVKLTLPIAQV